MLMIRDDVTETLVRNLRRLMQSREINAHELAARAGMNPTAVYDILSGKARSPKLESVAKLAAALSVTPSALIEVPAASELRSDLEARFQKLAPEDQERVLMIATALWQARSESKHVQKAGQAFSVHPLQQTVELTRVRRVVEHVSSPTCNASIALRPPPFK